MPTTRPLRLLALLLLTVATGLGVHRLVAAPLDSLWTLSGPLTLEPAAAGVCAAALALCWLWLAAGVWLTVLDAIRSQERPSSRAAPSICPRLVRSLVLLTLGMGVTGPAYADSGTGSGPGVVGLPVPDRVVVVAVDRTPTQVRVRPGDSLWRLAAQALPAGASDAAVDRAWRALAALNADRLGPDPDLIFPGTLLRVPRPGRLLGKDAS